MVAWFVGFALVVTWLVFHDPAIDYRLVVLGAVVPNGLLLVPVAVLVVVMLSTRGHRQARRRWLALPIAMFLHLVAGGTWVDTATFWWPFGGGDPGWSLPWSARAPAVLVLEEAAGLAAAGWFAVRFGLTGPSVASTFLRTGRLPRDRAA